MGGLGECWDALSDPAWDPIRCRFRLGEYAYRSSTKDTWKTRSNYMTPQMEAPPCMAPHARHPRWRNARHPGRVPLCLALACMLAQELCMAPCRPMSSLACAGQRVQEQGMPCNLRPRSKACHATSGPGARHAMQPATRAFLPLSLPLCLTFIDIPAEGAME